MNGLLYGERNVSLCPDVQIVVGFVASCVLVRIGGIPQGKLLIVPGNLPADELAVAYGLEIAVYDLGACTVGGAVVSLGLGIGLGISVSFGVSISLVAGICFGICIDLVVSVSLGVGISVGVSLGVGVGIIGGSFLLEDDAVYHSVAAGSHFNIYSHHFRGTGTGNVEGDGLPVAPAGGSACFRLRGAYTGADRGVVAHKKNRNSVLTLGDSNGLNSGSLAAALGIEVQSLGRTGGGSSRPLVVSLGLNFFVCCPIAADCPAGLSGPDIILKEIVCNADVSSACGYSFRKSQCCRNGTRYDRLDDPAFHIDSSQNFSDAQSVAQHRNIIISDFMIFYNSLITQFTRPLFVQNKQLRSVCSEAQYFATLSSV